MRFDGTRATRFARRKSNGILIDGAPTLNRSATVHHNHFNAGSSGNVSGAGIDGNKEIGSRSLAAKILDRQVDTGNDFVGVRTVIGSADDEKCRVKL